MSHAAADRRRLAVVAGHRGDVTTARHFTSDPDAEVRAAALGALQRCGQLTPPELRAALADPDAAVRRRAAELAAHHPAVELAAALHDPDVSVVEMAAWAVGERPTEPALTEELRRLATEHPDALCREAAVAALGALGVAEGRATLLAAMADRPAVRRRAVLGLANYDDEEVRAALRHALDDRDWQVRQAAEDLLRADGDPSVERAAGSGASATAGEGDGRPAGP